MVHGAVRSVSTAEMMAFHKAGKTAALADADHVHLIVRFEFVHQDTVAGLQIAVAIALQTNFAHESRALSASLLQMACLRFGCAGSLHEFEQTQLHRIVAVRPRGLALRNHTWTGFE